MSNVCFSINAINWYLHIILQMKCIFTLKVPSMYHLLDLSKNVSWSSVQKDQMMAVFNFHFFSVEPIWKESGGQVKVHVLGMF